MTEDHRNWPPPRQNKTLTDAAAELAQAMAGPPAKPVKPRPWTAAFALALLLAGITAAVWLADWRWLVTGVVAYVAVAAASMYDTERRKRA